MSNFALANQRRAPLFERQALFASCESSTSLHSKMLFGCFVVLLFCCFVVCIVCLQFNKMTKKNEATRQRKKIVING